MTKIKNIKYFTTGIIENVGPDHMSLVIQNSGLFNMHHHASYTGVNSCIFSFKLEITWDAFGYNLSTTFNRKKDFHIINHG